MTRALLALCLLLAAVPAARVDAGPRAGSWTASVDDDDRGRLQLNMYSGRHSMNGAPYDRSAFSGLDDAAVTSRTTVPVRFALRREAGTIEFDGTFRDGKGAGQYTFEPNRGFSDALRRLGVRFEPKQGDLEQTLFQLTIFDVSTEYIRSMQAVGYRLELDDYVQCRIFRVDPAYVRDMAAVGFDHLSSGKLVETKIHGATPEYIRRMRAAGQDLPLDDYIQSRIFQVTPEFQAEMARAGYRDLDHDQLTQFRIHGVTPEFVAELRELGYARIPAHKLVEMRIHGVTPEFIRRVDKAGYRGVPIDKLVQMRIFNVEPEMVKALDDGAR